MNLTDLEKDFLRRFYEEPQMVEAVKKGFKAQITEHLPKITADSDITDEVAGQRVRAYNTTVEIIDKIFNKLAIYEKSKPDRDNLDLAR